MKVSYLSTDSNHPWPYGILVLMTLLLVFTLPSCQEDEVPVLTEVSLDQVLDAVGGQQAVDDLNTIAYKVTGSTYEYEQAIPGQPSPLKSNDYIYTYYSVLNERKIRKEYELNRFEHPTPYTTAGPLAILNGQEGSLSGQKNWRSYYFGEEAPYTMFSSELEAHFKNHRMSNPLELLKEVLQNEEVNANTEALSYELDTRVAACKIKLHIDPDTHLPASASIIESDFLQGDITYEIFYKNWKTIGNFKFPSRIECVFDGEDFKLEDISDVRINPTLDENLFTPEASANPRPFDEGLADKGVLHSHFYHRWEAWNIPWPEPVDNGAMDLGNFDLTTYGIPSQYIGPNVKIIGRPDNRLWGLAIKTSKGIISVDAPLNPEWTRSIYDATKAAYPGEDIVGVISTHNHHDHFGGIREAAYEADDLYIAPEGRAFLDKVLSSSHNLVADNLARTASSANIIEVNDVTYLDNGAIEIHRLAPSNTSAVKHAEDMLVVYIPEYKALWQSDQLWNGTFMKIWDGYGARGFTPEARVEISNNAKFLYDYILEKGLDVEKILAAHGGLGTIEELARVANP